MPVVVVIINSEPFFDYVIKKIMNKSSRTTWLLRVHQAVMRGLCLLTENRDGEKKRAHSLNLKRPTAPSFVEETLLGRGGGVIGNVQLNFI